MTDTPISWTILWGGLPCRHCPMEDTKEDKKMIWTLVFSALTWTSYQPALCVCKMYQKASKFLGSVSTGTVLLLILLACGAHVLVHIHVPILRKVVRKSACDKHKRYRGWFWVHCSSEKFKRMAWEAMDICLWVLKEGNKSSRNSVLIILIVMCTFFPTTFLKIAVYKMATCADTRQY